MIISLAETKARSHIREHEYEREKCILCYFSVCVQIYENTYMPRNMNTYKFIWIAPCSDSWRFRM